MEKEHKEIEIYSDEVQEVMNRIPPAILRYGMVTITAILVLLLAGSTLFRYPDTMKAAFSLTLHEDSATAIESYASVPMASAGKVVLGQRVLIRLDGCPEGLPELFEGTVKSISPYPDGNGNYLLEVELREEIYRCLDENPPLIRKMTGTADIVLRERSLFQRITNL